MLFTSMGHKEPSCVTLAIFQSFKRELIRHGSISVSDHITVIRKLFPFKTEIKIPKAFLSHQYFLSIF